MRAQAESEAESGAESAADQPAVEVGVGGGDVLPDVLPHELPDVAPEVTAQDEPGGSEWRLDPPVAAETAVPAVPAVPVESPFTARPEVHRVPPGGPELLTASASGVVAPPAASEPVDVREVTEVVGTRAARRAATHSGAISPLRALAGAAVAVAGVALGIAALLWVRGDAPQGSPTVERPQAVGASRTPSAAPTPVVTVAPPVVTTPPPSGAATPPPTTTPTVSATPARAPVTVLNNSRRTDLAKRAAARFAAGGWTIRQTGNFTGRVATTSVYYAPGQEAIARRFARQFGIGRVAPRFSTLPGSGLTVVLTRDYNG